MKPKRHPTPEEFTMLDAMFNTDPEAWNNWLVSQGHEPFLDLPECLALIPKSEWSVNTKILPTPGIQKYLDSGDALTYHTIEMMELAMERDYQVEDPWFIIATVPFCKEGEAPVVEYFYLGKKS